MAGTTLILTRPADAAARFLAALSAAARARVRTVVAPLIEIVPLEWDEQGGRPDAAIFSSAQGVRHAPDGQGRPAYCVGAKTTTAARSMGWQAQHLGDTAAALVAALADQQPVGQMMHYSGTHRRGDIAEQLTAAGHRVEVCEVYDQRILPLSRDALVALQGPAIVPLFSPRTAQQFAAEAADLSCAHIIAMSHAVAEPLEGSAVGYLQVLAAPTHADMVKCVENRCLGASLP